MKKGELGRTLRRNLIAGLIVIAPVTVTAAVLWWIFQWLDGLVGRHLYRAMGLVVPGLGLLVLLVLLLLVGWLAQRAIGARIVAAWHNMLERFPLTRSVYSASNRIVRAVFTEAETRPFQEVVMIQFPSRGLWSLGFVTNTAPSVFDGVLDDGVTVFVPTTPNPTTGFLINVRRAEVIPVAMTTEQAFTYILSAGSVAPEGGVTAAAVPAAPGAELR